MGNGQYDKQEDDFAVNPLVESRELSSENVLVAHYDLTNPDGSLNDEAPRFFILGIRANNNISQSLLVILERDEEGMLQPSVQVFDSSRPFYPFGDKMFVIGANAQDPDQYFVQLQRGHNVEFLSGEYRNYPVGTGSFEVHEGQILLCPNNDLGYGATLTGIDGIDSLTITSGTEENGHTSMINYIRSNGRDSISFSDDLPLGYVYDLSREHGIPCMLINLGDTVGVIWLAGYPIAGYIDKLPE